MKSVPIVTIKQSKPSSNSQRQRRQRDLVNANDFEPAQGDEWMNKFRQNLLADHDEAGSEILLLAHEIRNPLTAISLANKLLREHTEDQFPSLHVLSEIIARNICRVESILKQLLEYNKESKLDLCNIDICAVIEKSLQKAEDRIFLKRIKVVKSYGFDMLVHADAEALCIAFLNIIVNAIEALDEKGKIWVTVYRTKDEVKVIFKDNGIGMDPEVACHIFEKDYSRKSSGFGIGLWGVKRILEEHGATITVNSEKGTGTILVISFKNCG